MPLKFLANKNTLVFGLSGSGKTNFVRRVLSEQLIAPFPDKVYFFFSIRQDWMKEASDIIFVQGLQLDKITPNSAVIIDDLALENHKKTCQLFLVESHHRNLSLFYLTQNLFPRDESTRLMAMNSHYIVLMSDPRSLRQIKTLAHKLFDDDDKNRLIQAYKSVLTKPYNFVLLSFLPGVPRELTVLTNYWSETPSVYL